MTFPVRRFFEVLTCFCAVTLPARAQDFPRNVPGITVTGRATLVAHADVLFVSALIAPVQPNAADVDAAAAAVVTVLRTSGADDAESAAAIDDGAVDVGRSISGTLHEPTIAKLTDVTRSVAAAAKRFPDAVLTKFDAAPGLAHCQDVEGQLQQAALQDARARAQRLAAAAGVKLGVPTIITPGGLPNYAFACSPRRGARRSTLAGALPADGNVEFGLFVNVTFAIIARS